MSLLRKSQDKSTAKEKEQKLEKSIYASNVRVDKNGQGWEKKSYWLRQEYLSKLKVIGHFENKKTGQLIDEALKEFLTQRWDNSMAMKKLVGKDQGSK